MTLSTEQIQQILAENERSAVEIQELNYLLDIREKEIEELKSNNASDAELRSMLDMRLDELQVMQNKIGKQQRQAAGAEEREFELQQELTQAARTQHQYNDLFQQYTYINTQLEDVQEQLAKLKKRNAMLQQIAVRIGELESSIENITLERDDLKARVAEYERLYPQE